MSYTNKSLPSFIENRLNDFYQDLINSNEGKKHLVMGKTPNANSVVMQSNDYLSLSDDVEIQLAHGKSLTTSSSATVMSAIFQQNEASKPRFEKLLAKHMGFECCLLSQSGWAANISLLQTICPPNTPVYIDYLAHMSLWDGAKFAYAKIFPFLHNDIKHMEKQIERNGPGIIIVDSIYSTIGTVAPLEKICEIARKTNCALLVDESHSLGTHGKNGEGLVQQLGLTDEVDFITTSLAKTFAYRAGAILGPKKLVQTLPFVAFPAIFSSALLPAEIARLEKTLQVIRKSDFKRKHLKFISSELREGLKRIGFTIRSDSQIIALECGGEKNTEKVRDFLEKNNVFGSVFCRPATTKNKNIIRFSLNAEMTTADIEHVIDVCEKAYHLKNLSFK